MSTEDARAEEKAGGSGEKPLLSEEVAPPRQALVADPEAEERQSTEQRFRELARQWKEETQYTSSTTEMVMHPAYQQIIGMGREALPLLFTALRQKPDHWFWALKAITGEDPVVPADRGKIRRMAQAWLDWAERRGY
ncbi:MAG TPA: hypothetical protein VNX28_08090 [Gemmataceae bacterium]|nr:hypothetical protein [Gemmataceae bacterium]